MIVDEDHGARDVGLGGVNTALKVMPMLPRITKHSKVMEKWFVHITLFMGLPFPGGFNQT